MVEGPTAKAYALRIEENFKNSFIEKIETKSKKIFIDLNSLIGKKIKRVETIGKNIILLINGFAIRLHLMMYGTIHIYSLNEPLLKPERLIRLIIQTREKKLVVYNAPIVEIGKDDLVEKLLKELGRDPLREDWDREETLRRIKACKGRKIGEVLLDQKVIAGIGNILRNEILFRAKIHPERLVDELKDEEIRRILGVAEKLCKKFLEFKLKKKRIKPLLFVYNRHNKLCRVCCNPIKFYLQEPIKRKTFVCENCQK